MSDQWTMKAFLLEHDAKWENHVSQLKDMIADLEKENEYLRGAYNHVVQAYNENVGDYDDTYDETKG